MHISIFSYGTWGDIRPHVVLGVALKSAGHDVQVVASPAYEEWVRARGLDFCATSVDTAKFTAEIEFEPTNWIAGVRAVLQELPDLLTKMGEDVLAATSHADVFLSVEFAVAMLLDVLKHNKLKTIGINPAPLSPSRDLRFVGFPPAPSWWNEGAYNKFTWDMIQRIQWMSLAAPRNRMSKKLGLPKPKFSDFKDYLKTVPALTIVSPHVIPRPDDWSDHYQMTGYLFDEDDDWEAPQELLDFLAAGEAPVYMGFGSMPDKSPKETTQTIIEGIQKAGKRGIILKGWAGLQAEDIPDDIYILNYAPHNWLFPKMSAVVHHGGAGTTASGLLAGVPTTIVPYTGDQPFWGRHVKNLGVGTEPIPKAKLTADKLAAALTEATSNPTIKENANRLGEKIQAEDGLSEAMKWMDIYLKEMG